MLQVAPTTLVSLRKRGGGAITDWSGVYVDVMYIICTYNAMYKSRYTVTNKIVVVVVIVGECN